MKSFSINRLSSKAAIASNYRPGFRAVLGMFLATFLLLIMGSVLASAQETSGNIAGTVLDKGGAAISGASITATNVATGVVSTVRANGVGQFYLPNLPPGTYNVSANAAGFATFTLKGFVVTLNTTASATLTLPIASAATVIEVSAEAGMTIDTTTTQLQTTFESQELKNLPASSSSNGVLNLSLFVPGVASGGGLGVGTGPSVGGLRPEDNNYTIEGIDNNNKGVTGPLVYVPNDSTGEFTAIVNQFSPEFGHSAGGQFNTTVLSGTNHFHGVAYEYFQNRNMNAENGFQGGKIPNPRYDNNRYGGQIGGPIKKDKLFFFSNFERQGTARHQRRAAACSGSGQVPDTACAWDALRDEPDEVPGWDLVELTYSDTGWWSEHVASFGADVVVIEPTDLRDAVIGRLKGVLA